MRRISFTVPVSPSKVTGTDNDRSATEELLLFFRTVGLSCTVSEMDEIESDDCEIVPPLLFNASVDGVPLGIL